MSINIKNVKKGKNSCGIMEIASNSSTVNAEIYVERVSSLIRLLQTQDAELKNADTEYHILEILSDMMPTEEQAKKMFDCSN